MSKTKIDKNSCKGCTLCISACPLQLIRISKQINAKGYFPAEFDDKNHKCTACALCAIMCPDVAIEVYREKKMGGDK